MSLHSVQLVQPVIPNILIRSIIWYIPNIKIIGINTDKKIISIVFIYNTIYYIIYLAMQLLLTGS